jgi:hypothetical protein
LAGHTGTGYPNPGSKITHFKKIHHKTSIAYSEMVMSPPYRQSRVGTQKTFF